MSTDQYEPPFVRGSDTSRAAADSVVPHLAKMERAVMDAFEAASSNGLTDDELEVRTGFRHQTASARRRGLEQRGFVYRTEMKRKTRSGRNAHVYVLTLKWNLGGDHGQED